MAQRRMFSMKVVDTDAFCDMSSSAQNLYFHIGMRADDEGFFAGVRGLMAKIHASQDDLSVLIAKHYILDRGDGVYVVKHWKMNNYLQNDRIHETEYEEKKAGLFIKKDGSYTLDPAKSAIPVVSSKEEVECIQNVSIEKNRVDLYESRLESSEEEKRIDEKQYEEKTKKGACESIYSQQDFMNGNGPMERCEEMIARKRRGEPIPQEWEKTIEFYEKLKAEGNLPF